MTQKIIDVGANANDGTGEPLRNAFTAVNDNFTEIWTAGPVGSQVQISGNVVSTTVTNLGLTLAGNGIGNIQANSSFVPGTPSVYDIGGPDNKFQYIYGDYFIGNGALLTGIGPTYSNVNVAAFLPTYTGNLISLTGPVRTTSNVVAGNLITTGFLGVSGSITGGNITGDNINSYGYISATGNIIGGFVNATGANIAGNISILGNILSSGVISTNSVTANVITANSFLGGTLLTTGAVSALGNVTAPYFVGNGAGLTGLVVAGGTEISYGTSNVKIGSANANVVVGVAGSGNVATFSTTGLGVTGSISATTLSAVGNVSGGNLSVSGNIAANYFTGNGSLLTGIAVTNVNASALIGTVLSANVLYSSLQVVGNLLYVNVNGNVTTTGKFIGSGDGLTNIPGANVTGTVANATSAVTAGTAYSVSAANIVGTVPTAIYATTAGTAYSVAGVNVSGTVANATYALNAGSAASALTANVANVANSVAGANVTGTVANATYATSAGSSTTAVSANTAVYANIANLVTGANVVGTVANATYATSAGSAATATSASYASVVTNPAQPNITSVGTLSSLSVSGNITSVGNISGTYILGNGALLTGISGGGSTNAADLTGTTLSSNVLYSSLKVVDDLLYLDVVGNITTTGKFIGSGDGLTNIPGANVTGTVAAATTAGTVTTAAQPNITSVGNLTSLTSTGNVSANYFIGNGSQLTGLTASNVSASALIGDTLSSNVLYSSLKVVDDLLYLDVVGNVTTTGRFAGSGAGLTNIPGANVTGTVSAATIAGTVTATAQPNITSVGNLTSLTSTGNITASYFVGNGSQLSGLTASNVAASALIGDTLSSNVLYSSLKVVDDLLYLDVVGNITTTGKFIGSGDGLTDIPGANITGNVSAAVVAGTVTANAQPNITSVGTLTSVSSTGNVSANYFIGNGALLTNVVVSNINASTLVGNTLSSNVLYSSLKVVDDLLYLDVVGNITAAGTFVGNGAGLTNVAATTAITVTASAQPNITSVGNLTSVNVTGNATAGNLVAVGNIVGGTLASSGKISAVGNVTGGNLTTSGNLSIGLANIYQTNQYPPVLMVEADAVQFISNINVGTNIQTNYLAANSVISATGNIATASYFVGNGRALTGIIATEIGNLASLSVSGNIIGGNILSNGIVSSTGNVIGGNLVTAGNATAGYFVGNGSQLTGIIASAGATIVNGNSNVTVTGSSNVLVGVAGISNVAVFANTGAYVTGVVSATGNVIGNYILGNGALLTGVITSVANINNGSSNITVVSSGGNIAVGVTGTSNVAVFAATGEYINGELSASGNITGNYFIGNGSFLTGVTASGVNAAALTGNTLSSTVLYSSLTQVGNLANLSVVGNTTSGNLLTAGIVSAAGNITGNYIFGNGSQLTGIDATSIQNGNSNVRVAANSNVTIGIGGIANVVVISTTGEYVTGVVSASGNVTGANILTTGLVSASGDVAGNNILASGFASVTGNVIAGNVNTSNIRPVSGPLTISTTTGNIELLAAGNLVLANTIVNRVAYPLQDTDAASKIYVDNMVSTGLAYHAPVVAATTTTLDVTTGGTITYTQPNGVANGVGAVLTTTGSFNLVDTANVQTVGTRILVKNEGNAVLNGAYTWANATAIVRSTDADQYGSDSSETISLNDYFFVQGGNINKGSAYVVSAPVGIIVFGTSNIEFSQFSSSQSYTANTDAGLSLIGTQFNAKVDQNTTAFDVAGNIIVKAGANLTTPNIGAATGVSLSVTGNITADYIIGNIGAVTGILGNNVNMGTNSAGALISNAVSLTANTTVTNGIALLNQVLGKLVPPAPPNFPNATTIALTGIATYRMANITQVDNTPGANRAVAAGTSVANVLRVATYATNTITNTGPGDSGTIVAVRNGANVGNVTLNTGASPSANGTYGGNLVISNNFDYNSANANIASGFWYVFSSRVSGTTASAGWNELYIADTATGNTNTTVWYYDNSSPSTPAFSSSTMTPPGSANLLYSSTIPHYTNNNNFTISFNVANVSGNTYPTSNTLASGSSGGAFTAPASINYNASNIGSNILSSFASASANTTASITTGFGASSTGPSMSVNNSYSSGTLTLTTALGNTVLWKSGTATAIDESNVVINTTIGTGSGNAYRIINPGTGNTPAFTGSEAAFNSQSSTLETYDATVVGSGSSGLLKHDQTNYSTGYLPAGPNLSAGRTGTQYFTIKFVRTAVSKFDIKYSGNVAGMWVALPGSVIDASSSANGWINMSVAYGGAGYPGVNAPGNGSDGCAVGGIVSLNTSVTNSSKTCTFGTVSSSSTATNEIYVRIALTAGQSVTALTLETASN